MSRLASKMAAGYFPSPPAIVRTIARHLAPPRAEFRILDPCAGKGAALNLLRTYLYGRTFGIELDAERAGVAAKYVDKQLTGDYAACRMPKKQPGISLLFVNPPYDHEEETGRLELKFLRDTQDWLVPGGILVYIIPQYRISNHIAKRLSTHFKDVRVYRFPDPEFAAFRQVVIFGVKRTEPMQDDATTMMLLAAQKGAMPVLPQNPFNIDRRYQIPTQPDTPFHFIKAESDPDDVLTEALAGGAWNTQEWKDLMTIRDAQAVQPLMPLKRSHIAMVLAAGLMDNLEVEQGEETYLVKGRLVKVKKSIASAADRDKGLSRTRESFEASITVLDTRTGQLTTLDDQVGLREWLMKWQGPLAAKIIETFHPLHDMTYDGLPGFHQITAGHSKHRKLKGRRAMGLFEAQKQVVAALTRRFMSGEDFAFIQGKMGVGKTTVSISLADVLKRYLSPTKPFPVIVTCPPHLVNKWCREIAAIVPMARGIIVRRPSDLERYVKDVKATGDRSLVVAVVSSEMLKRASGWTPSVRPRHFRKRHTKETYNYQTNRYDVEEIVEDINAFACPECGQTIRQVDKDGRVSYIITDAKYFKKKRTCHAKVKKWMGNADGVKGYWKEVECKSPLYQSWRGRWPKEERDGFGHLMPVKEVAYPIAQYIEKNYPSFFELAIIDELHEYKAASSDRGHRMGTLVKACKRTLGMTGTMFGGFSTSLFFLLHRIDPRIKREFSWSDKMRWASLYGVLERVIKGKSDGDDDYGVYSGLRRRKQRVVEKPGISPALVTRLLDSTAFLTLQDLDLQLPDYTEKPVILKMFSSNGDSPDQAEIYNKLAGDLLKAALDDFSLMSEYLQTTLAWPNACWRDEETSLYTVPALDPNRLYPKEEWLRNEVQRQKCRGRKVLLFVRQTATRDIQPRLKQILEVGGLSVKILRSSVGTTRREAWVKRHANNGLDVLICNPRLVQTGLDLCEFPTIIVYEPEYSIYLMMQATARSWRPGQVNDVEVYFPVYANTMEHRAVAHVGKKIAAAQLLYGDDVAGALVDQAGIGGSFLEELASEVIANTAIPDLNAIFVQKSREAEGGWLTGHEVSLLDQAIDDQLQDTATWTPDLSTANQISMF